METKSQNLKKHKAGFTLIELLVVIAIIALLASVVLVALNGSRQKSRDAKRVADMNQLAKAMELYFNDKFSYPTGSACTIGVAGCLTASLIPNYLVKLPLAPAPSDNPGGSTACSSAYGAGIGNDYQYAATAGATTANYTITFCLGGLTGALPPGIHTLTSAGFQ